MKVQKRGLGKGLEALLGNNIDLVQQDKEPIKQKFANEQIHFIDINLIDKNPNQPRLDINFDDLEELIQSIKNQGVLQPILVRAIDDRFELVAGERRLQASKYASLSVIPALIREIDDKQSSLIALIENIQREDLNVIEQALAFEKIEKNFNLNQTELAEFLGKPRATIANILRLLKLPKAIQRYLIEGAIDLGHAKLLVSLNENLQMQIVEQVIDKELTVAATEKLIKKLQNQTTDKQKEPEDANINKFADKLSEKLGAIVQIKHSQSGKGRLIVKYNSLDELQNVVRNLTIEK